MSRLDRGEAHERAVAEKLTENGWHVEAFGQGLFTERTKRAMQQHHPKIMLRWLPDLIASRGTRVILVEAKWSDRTDTDNFSIEIDSMAALTATEVVWGIPVYIVWRDFSCNRAARLRHVRWEPRPTGTQGSNTPYMLVAKKDQHPFDEAFGRPLADAA